MPRKKFMTKGDKRGLAFYSIQSVMKKERGIYLSKFNDFALFQPFAFGGSRMSLESLEDLLKRDEQREKDGFPKKIKIGRILAASGKVILVPTVVEEKLLHGDFEPSDKEEGGGGDESDQRQGTAGQGEGEKGDVIGEIPMEGQGEGEEPNAGDEPGEHGIETEAYKIGKELSEKFKLPNLKDKGKKIPSTEYIYDLTDRHRGSGQVLDKKATIKSIVKTNLALGRIDKNKVDTTKLIVGPDDKIYRVLSRERVWKSQAIVFLVRDYSGSMWGEPTKAVVSQHLMIYSWLLVQYEKLVIPRFIVHDTQAKEVTVNQYYRATAGGGTLIASAFKKINEIVESEGLAASYNIYVFYGTDGDDFDAEGRQAIPEIRKILTYANRMGVSVVKNPWYKNEENTFEKYIKNSGILSEKQLFRMNVMSSEGVTEEKNIEAIKELISQD